jgi:hydroxyacylglutathione hydrolase
MKSIWKLAVFIGCLLSNDAGWADLKPSSMDAKWDAGDRDCQPGGTHVPLQVHRFDAQTFVLRESLCSTWEAPFIYLLIGSKKALLVDTGDIADPKQMPLQATVFGLLPSDASGRLPLLVVHSHGHLDHRAGDPQFSKLQGVTVVPADLEHVRQYFGLTQWPEGSAQIDLGDRLIDVIPAPGHHPAQVVYYDRNTGLVLSGDFLLPGRLLVDDFKAYALSAERVASFFKDLPVSYVWGGHVEKNRNGELFDWQSTWHPDEQVLELPKADLLLLPAALQSFNGFYTNVNGFIIENPIHNLVAGAAGALIVLTLLVFSLYRLWKRYRARRARA